MLLYRSIPFPNGLVSRAIRSYATISKPQQYSTPQLEDNNQTESNRLSKTLTKFWSQVSIESNENHHAIKLDNKTIRTPLGNFLEIPTNRSILAHLLHHEWSSLSNLSIKTHNLPLTSLVARVIDLEHANLTKNEELQAKVGIREDIIEDLLRYFDTDTLLVFAPQAEYEGKLRSKQEELYRPIISQIEKLLEIESGSINWLDTDVGLRGNQQSENVRSKARSWLLNLDFWDLVALEKVTLSAKSLICGILTLRAKSHGEEIVNLEKIAECATLEVGFQTEKWGEVEDTHDVDYQDIRRNINSAGIISFRQE
ncbi:hypothetical protein BN7_2518 [Wickerhamomyces ciferrii]|uniref:ATP synthase mitochondrial F1 complex assembly factor 2 n=1 Tax=Wickerhamomyces ciferrii (strain ATCC 14091 / BCRC 22168 / CBS 111 / JCM 3599 / NBRC 0793 / NRRL Y-1031 F-60-10) TaxID=1206466 RepID=K0KL99_WICCF|nr:uncharacterized protein BN7_2518 [Wickerhamomyces ciferrii]CCH42972.1 hypothetical protein BN7_2518 [Wickerhamomyces ciferrii]